MQISKPEVLGVRGRSPSNLRPWLTLGLRGAPITRCLDVQMGEDACAIHDENAATNVAALKRIALILLRRNESFRQGEKVKGVAARQEKANRSTD